MRSDSNVQARRIAEERHAALVSSAAGLNSLSSAAIWEAKSSKMARNAQIADFVHQAENADFEELNIRRSKLSHLLHAEAIEYEIELKQVAQKETPSERLARLTERALELKTKRDNERKLFAEAQLARQWRAAQDELRQADSKLEELLVTADRDIQVEEKREQAAIIRKEEELFDAIMQERFRLEGLIADKKKAELKAKVSAIRGVLDGQVKQRQNLKAACVHRENQEAQLMIDAIANADAEEKIRRDNEAKSLRDERLKLTRWLEDARSKRQADEQASRAIDKAFVDSVLLRERQASERERAEKAKYIEQMLAFNQALRADLAKQAESYKQAEEEQANEQERQWQRRFKQWEAEDKARRTLLEEVYAVRAEQLEAKDKQRSLMRSELEKEKVDHLNKIQIAANMTVEEEQRKQYKLRQHVIDLDKQVIEKSIAKQNEIDRIANENRLQAMKEENLQKAINEEKERQLKAAQEIANRRAHKIIAPWDR